MSNPVQNRKPLPPLPARAYRHRSADRLFEDVDERVRRGESCQPERREPSDPTLEQRNEHEDAAAVAAYLADATLEQCLELTDALRREQEQQDTVSTMATAIAQHQRTIAAGEAMAQRAREALIELSKVGTDADTGEQP